MMTISAIAFCNAKAKIEQLVGELVRACYGCDLYDIKDGERKVIDGYTVQIIDVLAEMAKEAS
jgi:hypothetical protein